MRISIVDEINENLSEEENKVTDHKNDKDHKFDK
jgi:hypothetical protein